MADQPPIIDTLTPMLQELGRRVQEPGAPAAAIGGLMVASTQRTFELQGRPERFKALSLMTLLGRAGGISRAVTRRGTIRAAAARRMAGAKILIDSSRLLRSIEYAVSGKQIEWGTNVIYAALQHFGGQAGRGRKVTVPARPFVHEPFEEDWRSIGQILAEWLGWAS